MKKLIISLSLLAVMLGFSIAEVTLTSKFYKGIHSELHNLSRVIELDTAFIDRPEVIGEMDKVLTQWGKGRKYCLMVSNHIISRNIDEKLIALQENIKTNNYNDATVTLSTSMNYVHDLIREYYPDITNLL